MTFYNHRSTLFLKRTITKALWKKLILELRVHGAGKTESGAFLLGVDDSNEITAFVSYDDLDPGCYDSKIIRFSSAGFRALAAHCAQHGLIVLADVHTHPYGNTSQSGLDKTHPMIVERGHLAMIVPHYAAKNTLSVAGVGFYEYLGDFAWRTFTNSNEAIKLI